MIIKTVQGVKREKIPTFTQSVMKNDHKAVTNIIASFLEKIWGSTLDHPKIFT